MNKRFIFILIGIITSALIGLVAIQIYWINHAITLKEEEFEREIKSSLLQVTYKLEKIEAFNRIKSDEKGRRLLRRNNQLRQRSSGQNSDFDTSAVYEQNGVRFEVHESLKNKKNNGIYQHSVQSVSPNGRVGFQLSFGVQKNQVNKFPADDSSMAQESQLNSDMISEVLESIAQANIYRSIMDRVDKKLLDSLLRSELFSRDINANYHFAVFDYDGKEVMVDSAINTNKLLCPVVSERHLGTTPFSYTVFP